MSTYAERDHQRLTEAAWGVLQAASEPITFPSSAGSDVLVLVPASYLEFLRSALEPEPERSAS